MPHAVQLPSGDPSDCARPEVLVTTEWVHEHLHDPTVRLIECDEDLRLYGTGHLEGAVRINWHADLNDPVQRDYVDRERLQTLLRLAGVRHDTTVVIYGDNSNWWAAFAFWLFSLFGTSRLRMTHLRIMDGGRSLWQQEGRPLTRVVPRFPSGDIVVGERNDRIIRAFREDVLQHVQRGGKLVDVRSAPEYEGRRLHMPGYPNEGALRAGHIPGAIHIPWESSVTPGKHTFRTAAELAAIYTAQHGLQPTDDVITYCRIGERSAHSWFVLSQLLGFTHVRNYDGSWCEWGNSVRVPIER